jgi:hypothetical protein
MRLFSTASIGFDHEHALPGSHYASGEQECRQRLPRRNRQRRVVAVDAALAFSESRTLRAKLAALGNHLLARQQSYLLAYCAAVKELGRGKRSITEEAKQALAARMEQFAPDAALGFLIVHSADAVARELSAEVNQNDA